MKNIYLLLFLFLMISIMIIPLPAIPTSADTISAGKYIQSTDTVTVCLNNNSTEEIPRYDFIFGILCNLNPDYDDEAYKAQAVASYTLIEYELLNNTEKLDNADFSEKSVFYQNYLTPKEQKEKLKENYDVISKKINSVLSKVYGQQIVFEQKPILALSCELSAGKTESYETISGKKLNYLTPVQSVSDLLAPNYQTTVSLSPDKLKNLLADFEIKWTEDKSKWFTDAEQSESGTVIMIKVCETVLAGKELSEALSLPSASFDVKYSDGAFKFICRGKGDGVGLSRFGANYMAENGCTYKEILKWYFTSCTLSE